MLAPAASPMLSIVIVGWNCADEVGACLESVFRHPPSTAFEIIYVDNASTDGSADRVRRAFPSVRLIANARNAGFQRANNQALAASGGSEILLLNPDARVLPGSLDALFGFLRATPEAGAASPRCVSPDGRVQWTTAPFPSLAIVSRWFWTSHPVLARALGRARRDESGRVQASDADAAATTREQAYAYGACFATRREVVEAVGPMDEGFFLAGGEVAWSREMQRRGWKTYYVAEATIVHRAGVARGRRSWVSELDWVASHRRLLYLYEGLRAGIIGDLFLTAHLLLWAGNRAASVLARPFRSSRPVTRPDP
jgi:GT2 family glycosyltransferase